MNYLVTFIFIYTNIYRLIKLTDDILVIFLRFG